MMKPRKLCSQLFENFLLQSFDELNLIEHFHLLPLVTNLIAAMKSI